MPPNDMIWREIEKKASELEEYYRAEFAELFGQFPSNCNDKEKEDLRWAVQQYSPDVVRSLVKAYLRLKDDWLAKQGYPFSLFKRSVNAAIVSVADEIDQKKPVYVVALTESGKLVCSHSRNCMGKEGNYHPILWDDWVKQPYEEKLQKTKWECDISDWRQNWMQWGFLNDGSPTP